jgi:hypothetical protein
VYDVVWKRNYEAPPTIVRAEVKVTSAAGVEQPVRIAVDAD